MNVSSGFIFALLAPVMMDASAEGAYAFGPARHGSPSPTDRYRAMILNQLQSARVIAAKVNVEVIREFAPREKRPYGFHPATREDNQVGLDFDRHGVSRGTD